VAAGRHRNLEGRHATLHMDDTSVVASGPTVHEGEQRGQSVSHISTLRQRAPRPWAPSLRHRPTQEPTAQFRRRSLSSTTASWPPITSSRRAARIVSRPAKSGWLGNIGIEVTPSFSVTAVLRVIGSLTASLWRRRTAGVRKGRPHFAHPGRAFAQWRQDHRSPRGSYPHITRSCPGHRVRYSGYLASRDVWLPR